MNHHMIMMVVVGKISPQQMLLHLRRHLNEQPQRLFVDVS